MSQASRDENRVPTLIGVSSADLSTPTTVSVNPINNHLKVDAIVEETAPTDTSKSNPSMVLGYTGDNLTTITKTIGSTSYTKTLTYTGDILTSISVWVEV